jgi:hypothetical protein
MKSIETLNNGCEVVAFDEPGLFGVLKNGIVVARSTSVDAMRRVANDAELVELALFSMKSLAVGSTEALGGKRGFKLGPYSGLALGLLGIAFLMLLVTFALPIGFGLIHHYLP